MRDDNTEFVLGEIGYVETVKLVGGCQLRHTAVKLQCVSSRSLAASARSALHKLAIVIPNTDPCKQSIVEHLNILVRPARSEHLQNCVPHKSD